MEGSASILVVGAGPSGLALACELYRRGVPCRIIEAEPERGTRSKAIAIWPRVLEILADLGVADEAVETGLRLDGSDVWSQGRRALQLRLDGLGTRYPFGLVLPQYETERLLERRLGELGGKVERGVRCESVRPGADGVTVTVRQLGGKVEQVRADWVVGCDGAASVVRAGAGIAMRQRLEPEGWIAADVRLHTGLGPRLVNYFLDGGRVLHMVPLRMTVDGLTWRITMNVGQIRPDPADWPIERLAAAAAQRAAVPVEVVSTDWVTGFRVKQGLAHAFGAGRILVAGDAAHVHSPAGAQGINSGLQDSANLGWKLARVCAGRSAPALLSSYDSERRPAARVVVATTDRVTRMGTLRSPALVRVRNLLWRGAMRHGLVDRVVAPASAGLAQRLPGRRLPGAAPGPGTRLPDVLTGTGRLWDRLPPGEFCVLVLGADAGEVRRMLPDPVTVLRIDETRVSAALRARPGTAFVVRPDRYLAVRCPVRRPQAIVRYFHDLQEVSPCRAPET